MSVQRRYTSRDLDSLPHVEGVRYEIIDGELHVSSQPSWHHQRASDRINRALGNWDGATGLGESAQAPGVIFAEDDDVAPDIVWISREKLEGALDGAGHLRVAPDLVVEVLSPGSTNVRRDRVIKLDLYSRQGVREYWIVDCRLRTVEIFRREGTGLVSAALLTDDVLTTPLLPDFSLPLPRIW